jgi:ABC-type transport system substrate-binding protein
VVPMPSVGWPEMATVLQNQWKKVGVTAELVIRERAVYDQLTKGSDFDIDATNISRADAFQYAAYLYGRNVPFPNNGGYKGADALIEAAAREMDTTKRLELWRQFQQKALVEDVAGFGMTNVRYALAWRKGIKGVDAMYQDSFPVWKMSL